MQQNSPTQKYIFLDKKKTTFFCETAWGKCSVFFPSVKFHEPLKRFGDTKCDVIWYWLRTNNRHGQCLLTLKTTCSIIQIPRLASFTCIKPKVLPNWWDGVLLPKDFNPYVKARMPTSGSVILSLIPTLSRNRLHAASTATRAQCEFSFSK